MMYVWGHCHQAADIMRIEPPSWHYPMDLGFAIHEATLLKHEAIQSQFFFRFCDLPIALNLMRKTGLKRAK